MKKFFELINGRKTTISAIAGQLLAWAVIKGYVDAPTATLLGSILAVWTGAALAHKGLKKEL